MVGFNINSFINQEHNDNSNIHTEFQSSELQKCSTSVQYKSNLSALKTSSVNSFCLSKNYRNYKCLICQKVFSQRSIYQTHLRTHGQNIDPYRCNICEKSFAVPARLTRHYRTHTGEKPYQCEYCNKSFSVKENLSVHRRIHTKERPYKCDVCDSAFEHSGKLHRHMRIHTGERPHKCSLCSKTFIQSGQLVIHMRTHTGEKPYICKSCGKGFTCSKQLKVHTRTHTGEKPYKCDICGKSFGYNHVLKLHQVAHYGEKFYKCTLCEETFNSKKLMEIHIKFHSNMLTNNSNSTELIFDNIKTIENNKILVIGNKKENRKVRNTDLLKSIETRNKNETSNNVIYPIFQHRNEANHQKKPNIVNNQSCLSISRNLIISKHINNIGTEVKHIQDVATKNNKSNHQYFFTDLNPVKSCIYEIEANNFFSKEYLPTFCLSNNHQDKRVETDVKIIGEKQATNNELENHENFTSPIYTNHFNLVIPNARDNFSLPPRKRCKMILESMKTQKIELTRF
ncbi:PREDICTED: zinc finger protein 2 homolog isoform X2 [Ceratosolen solmsi marchali]|uniref:Zinc finger protein 2 homolog isoform X2 n=1 Tax=Ceratosolen solmsi marchali TaxID=326594 RepID=A0AAJ6YSZ0_9HYME|nr:PREDICTED: zinc finger protein 2 homolog isoform X2 [Ceratosolen solmsi marchali]